MKSSANEIATYEELLNTYRSLSPFKTVSEHDFEHVTTLFENLLGGYVSVVREKPGNYGGTTLFESLLGGYQDSVIALRQSQLYTAEDFNLFEVLGIRSDELRHSRMLVWLTDRSSTHAQGTLGFKLLLKKLGLPDEYAETNYWVNPEVSGKESRIDVEIAARNQFLIHIENKILAKLGDAQLDRETRDAERRDQELGVPKQHTHGLFLTLRGTPKPDTGIFEGVSWSSLVSVFRDFSSIARAPSAKWFASHYADSLTRLITISNKLKENDED